MSGQVSKLGLKYWKLRAQKLTPHLINVAELALNNFMERSFPIIWYRNERTSRLFVESVQLKRIMVFLPFVAP